MEADEVRQPRGSFTALLAVTLIAAMLPEVAFAGPLEDAIAAKLSGDYSTALRLLRPMADEGNASAQNALGAMYAFGTGVPLDYVEAAKWYRKAADQGNPAAQYNLGVAFANGLGVSKDGAEALKWYRKAAEQGDADAQKLVREWKPLEQRPIGPRPPIPASAGIIRGAGLEVGRVTLQMSDDGWEDIGAGRRGLPFTGDKSGDIQVDTHNVLLRGKAGEFQAVVTVGASRGASGVRISWNTDCQAGANIYAVDGTGGRFGVSDCLKVSSPIQMHRFLESAAPDLLADLTGRSLILPNAAYLVFFEKGIDSGAFTFVRVMFAADFMLPNETNTAVDLPAGVKPEMVAWGFRLAEAVRSSIYSPSGTLLFPTVAAKVN